MQTNGHIQAEVETLIKEFRDITSKAKGSTKRLLNSAAKPVVFSISIAAPKGVRKHFRYGTAKLIRGVRAKRGSGQKVASYTNGNLRGSFQLLNLSKQGPYRVTIGSKLAKGQSTGAFGPSANRFDGYYAHMIERGTVNSPARPFVMPTWERMKDSTRSKIVHWLSIMPINCNQY